MCTFSIFDGLNITYYRFICLKAFARTSLITYNTALNLSSKVKLVAFNVFLAEVDKFDPRCSFVSLRFLLSEDIMQGMCFNRDKKWTMRFWHIFTYLYTPESAFAIFIRNLCICLGMRLCWYFFAISDPRLRFVCFSNDVCMYVCMRVKRIPHKRCLYWECINYHKNIKSFSGV